MRTICCLAIAYSTAWADSSVAKPPGAQPGWCVARFFKESQRATPTAPAANAKAKPFKLDTLGFELALPEGFAANRVQKDGSLQVGVKVIGTEDNFTDWPAVLQVRWQTHAELESRIKAIQSDFMGHTRPQIEWRTSTFQGKPAEEVCAIVRRTPGHATLLDGKHIPMPDIVELVRGYLIPVGDKTLGVVYRLNPQAIDQLATWDRMLESLRITP
jgi:hypothetical protein